MILADILRTKGNIVLTIRSTATLDDVVQTLVRHNCGSLIVCDNTPGDKCGEMLGIITERDILRACASRSSALDQVCVRDAMTKDPITAAPTDSVEETMGLMTERRIRHLPIMEAGELVGLISIGDLVKAQHDEFAVENHYMKNYIQS